MTNDAPIVIRRVGNGFIVTPYTPHEVMDMSDTLVFQIKGDAVRTEDSLLVFIDDHFSDKQEGI